MAHLNCLKTFHYYNEWDAKTAGWLRELIARGHLPDGIVDERSITEVTPEDLRGFRQWHFFAGIGGWPVALKLAGWPIDSPVCTGSPPCQPFSVAGKRGGRDDPRHLAPAFLDLLAELRPPAVFGEQVSAAIKELWLDALFLELEDEGYTCTAAVLPACSVGAPHKRDRLFFGALDLAHVFGDGLEGRLRWRSHPERQAVGGPAGRGRATGGVPHAEYQQRSDALPGLRSGGVVQGERDQETDPSAGRGGDDRMDNGQRQRQPSGWDGHNGRDDGFEPCPAGEGVRMANGDDDRQQPGARGERSGGPPEPVDNAGRCGSPGELPDAPDGPGLAEVQGPAIGEFPAEHGEVFATTGIPDQNHGFWSDADWLLCRDGNFRPVEPASFPLANGVPARVVRLRGYGNAIVPQVAAEFIRSVMVGAVDLTENI